MRGSSFSSIKESSSSGGSGWGILSWLGGLDWSTMRYLVFLIAFSSVALYQYLKWKRNKNAKMEAMKAKQQ